MNKKSLLGLVFGSVMIAAAVLGLFGATPTPNVSAAPNAKAWEVKGNKIGNKVFLGSTNNKPLVFKTNNVERMRLLANGNVGIGTSNPTSKVEIAAQDGLAITGFQPFLTLRDTNANNARAILASGNGDFGFYPNSFIGATPPVVIKNTTGNVGIGVPDPGQTLEVGGTFQVVEPGGGLYALFANSSDRTVSVGALAPSTTNHLCYFGTYTLSTCSSAAEYVPTIDSGKGYPQTADLVSIAPEVKNPYGDTHGPFVVQKSAKACDSNLLGYLVKPESGADGVNLNKHYQPLAIYGYFPAKVTMENGAIKRGDPITSSSKAGYGMKATDACKVIGYALADANTEGTIQVFANYGDNSAAQVAELQQENDALKHQLQVLADKGDNSAAQVAELQQENDALKHQLQSFEARLAALEVTTVPNVSVAAAVR